MSKHVGGIVRELMDEPHVAGHRVSVRRIHAVVDERDMDPRAVADSLDLDVADVYRALAYYHDNPDDIAACSTRRTDLVEASRERGAPTGPDDY